MDRTSRTHFGMDERGVGGTFMIQQQFIHMFRVIQTAEKSVDNGPPASSVFRRPYYSQCGEYWKRIKPSVIEAPSKVDSYPPDGYFLIKDLPINKKPPAVYVPAKSVIHTGRPRTASSTAKRESPRGQGEKRDSGEKTVGGLLTSRGNALLPPESILHKVNLSETTRDLIKAGAPEKLIDYATSIDTRRYQLDLELVKLSKRREAHRQAPLFGVADVASAAAGLLSENDAAADGKGVIGGNEPLRLAPHPPTATLHDDNPLASDPQDAAPLRRVASIDSDAAKSQAGTASPPRRIHSVRFLKDDGPQIAAEILQVSAPKRLKSFKRGGANASSSGVVTTPALSASCRSPALGIPSTGSETPQREAHAAAAHDVVTHALQSSLPAWNQQQQQRPVFGALASSSSMVTMTESLSGEELPCVPLTENRSPPGALPLVLGVIRPYQADDTADDER